ncbi:hypothetical protein Fmac_032050 [Flemingia macrophylla]|uniref:Uncharacterized protein n=1 Tax=Flemingia macrophylla TaxID=520843 RepID=A0ABD1L3S9_9FABA
MQGRLSSCLVKHGLIHRSLGFDYQGIETLQIKPEDWHSIAVILYVYGYNYLRSQCAYDVAPGGLLASVYHLTRIEYGIDQPEEEEFETIFSQARSEAASCAGKEEISPLNPIEEERLRNKSCFVAAGGRNPKGRVYGVGKLTEDYMRGDRLTQQTSSSMAADSQKIIQLEEEVFQSREEIRQSREENQRLQRKLQSLVNVVLPLLPPAAQTILQDTDEQQNDDQNHHTQQQDNPQHRESSPLHYADY